MRLNLYTQSNISIIVGGLPLTGFMEGDFLEFKIDGNAAERTLGADGPAMNISAKGGGYINITLKDTSPALGSMEQLFNLQSLRKNMFTVAVLSGVNEVITASGCAFGDRPAFATGGPKMNGRTFNIQCLAIAMDTAGVESVAGILAV